MLTKTRKKKVMDEVKIHDTDTGSTDVQIGLLTKKIDELAGHLKKNPKDNSSRRGLLQMVGKRRRLLNYLSQSDEKRYSKILKKLNLKK